MTSIHSIRRISRVTQIIPILIVISILLIVIWERHFMFGSLVTSIPGLNFWSIAFIAVFGIISSMYSDRIIMAIITRICPKCAYPIRIQRLTEHEYSDSDGDTT
jgi:hypothetical protein